MSLAVPGTGGSTAVSSAARLAAPDGPRRRPNLGGPRPVPVLPPGPGPSSESAPPASPSSLSAPEPVSVAGCVGTSCVASSGATTRFPPDSPAERRLH